MGPLFIDNMTTDVGVRDVAKKSIFFLSLFVFIDNLQGVDSGILRGVGRQELGAVTNVIAFYLIGLPLANVFSFKLHLGVPGLMGGMAFGTATQAITLIGLIWVREKQLFVAVVDIDNKDVAVNSYNRVSTGDIEMSEISDYYDEKKTDDSDDNDNNNNTDNMKRNITDSPSSVITIHSRVENVLRDNLANDKEKELKELLALRKKEAMN